MAARPVRVGSRRGLAPEGARAILDVAFEQLELPAVVSATVAPNLAPGRGMQKLGMRVAREESGDPYPVVVYRIDRADWARSPRTDTGWPSWERTR